MLANFLIQIVDYKILSAVNCIKWPATTKKLSPQYQVTLYNKVGNNHQDLKV